MNLEQHIARLFKMDEKARRRHSNPLSVYSRFSMVPLMGFAFWSRVWLGWHSIIPIAAVFVWIWINPRIFPEPKSTDNWASKVVMGEWVWMRRGSIPVPEHHRRLPNILSTAGLIGLVFFVRGLAVLDFWQTMFGAALIIVCKLWFADRMVWIYEDMREANPEYKSWLY